MTQLAVPANRPAHVDRALRLEYLTVGWNLIEGVVAISAALAVGSQTLEPALELVLSAPGSYVGAIIPTRTGDYLFRLTGTIADLNVDEPFESGPGRFDVVRSPASLQFPDQTGSDSALAREQRATREVAEQSRLVALGAASLGLAVRSLRGRSRTR